MALILAGNTSSCAEILLLQTNTNKNYNKLPRQSKTAPQKIVFLLRRGACAVVVNFLEGVNKIGGSFRRYRRRNIADRKHTSALFVCKAKGSVNRPKFGHRHSCSFGFSVLCDCANILRRLTLPPRKIHICVSNKPFMRTPPRV